MKIAKWLVVLVVVGGAVGAYMWGLPRLEKAKQKRTVADVRIIGTAMFSWLTDQVGTGPESPWQSEKFANMNPREQRAAGLENHRGNHIALALFAAAGDAGTGYKAKEMTVDLKQYTRISAEKLKTLLVPQYMQTVPEMDGWGRPYEFYISDNVLAAQVLAIRSGGRDGVFSGESYTVDSFPETSFDEDIVWSDGFFVRWPAVK